MCMLVIKGPSCKPIATLSTCSYKWPYIHGKVDSWWRSLVIWSTDMPLDAEVIGLVEPVVFECLVD